MFEELGWLGFARPRVLARHSYLATALMIGHLGCAGRTALAGGCQVRVPCARGFGQKLAQAE
jgi:hypothetical protein